MHIECQTEFLIFTENSVKSKHDKLFWRNYSGVEFRENAYWMSDRILYFYEKFRQIEEFWRIFAFTCAQYTQIEVCLPFPQFFHIFFIVKSQSQFHHFYGYFFARIYKFMKIIIMSKELSNKANVTFFSQTVIEL